MSGNGGCGVAEHTVLKTDEENDSQKMSHATIIARVTGPDAL